MFWIIGDGTKQAYVKGCSVSDMTVKINGYLEHSGDLAGAYFADAVT